MQERVAWQAAVFLYNPADPFINTDDISHVIDACRGLSLSLSLSHTHTHTHTHTLTSRIETKLC